MKKRGDLRAIRAFATYEDEARQQYINDWTAENLIIRTHRRTMRVDRAYLPLNVVVVREKPGTTIA